MSIIAKKLNYFFEKLGPGRRMKYYRSLPGFDCIMFSSVSFRLGFQNEINGLVANTGPRGNQYGWPFLNSQRRNLCYKVKGFNQSEISHKHFDRSRFEQTIWNPSFNTVFARASPIPPQRLINVPAVGTARCPPVSSPPPSGSPGAAGCSASARGCSRTPWTGCLLYSADRRDVGLVTQVKSCTFEKHKWEVAQQVVVGVKDEAALPPPSWCCPYCSQGWSWRGWRSSCWSCLSAASQLCEDGAKIVKGALCSFERVREVRKFYDVFL